MMKTLLREPLVHFLVLGGVLFGAYSLLQPERGGDAAPNEIRLSLDDLAQLAIVFESKWRRPPTADEFKILVENRVQEDVLYREALALGLDENDTIVKRRMAQKMRFLAEDVAAAREPAPDELRSWFAEHSDLFALPPRVSFRHLYFSTDRRGEQARDDAAKALLKLKDQPENLELAASLADPFMFQDHYGDNTPQAIAREFGPEFAQSIAKLTPGSWQGPLKSGYGWHLVFVSSAVPGRVPAYEEVETNVKVAWLGEQKAVAWRKAYEDMRGKYKVLLPVPAEGAKAAASGTAPPSDKPARDGGATR